jgi:hypothetical protein
MDIVDSIKSILYISLPPTENNKNKYDITYTLSVLHEKMKFYNYFLMPVFTSKLAMF